MIEAISTPGIPGGIGPNSQGIKAGGFLFLSGQTPVNPETKELNGDSIEPQAEQIMQNIRAILSHQGLEFTDVVKTTCFLSDMKDYAGFNAVYAKYFVAPRFTVRSGTDRIAQIGANFLCQAVCHSRKV